MGVRPQVKQLVAKATRKRTMNNQLTSLAPSTSAGPLTGVAPADLWST